MDAEHRHELKTNELADWLKQTPEYLKKNANTIIGIALIVVGLVTWPMFSRWRAASDYAKAASVAEAIDSLQRDLGNLMQSAQKDTQARLDAASAVNVSNKALQEQAQKVNDPNLKALALMKAAQGIRTELLWRAETIAVQDIEAKTQQAQTLYQQALDVAVNPTLRAMAQFGLGLCAEQLGQRDQAVSIYQAIIKEPSYATTHFPTLAQRRLDHIDKNMAAVVFAPAPAETTPAPEAPAEMMAAPAEPAMEPAAPTPAAPAEAPAAQTPQPTPPAPAPAAEPAESKP